MKTGTYRSRRTGKRLMCAALSAALVFCSTSVRAFAEQETGGKSEIITAFAPLPAELAVQELAAGAEESAIRFPESLEAYLLSEKAPAAGAAGSFAEQSSEKTGTEAKSAYETESGAKGEELQEAVKAPEEGPDETADAPEAEYVKADAGDPKAPEHEAGEQEASEHDAGDQAAEIATAEENAAAAEIVPAAETGSAADAEPAAGAQPDPGVVPDLALPFTTSDAEQEGLNTAGPESENGTGAAPSEDAKQAEAAPSEDAKQIGAKPSDERKNAEARAQEDMDKAGTEVPEEAETAGDEAAEAEQSKPAAGEDAALTPEIGADAGQKAETGTEESAKPGTETGTDAETKTEAAKDGALPEAAAEAGREAASEAAKDTVLIRNITWELDPVKSSGKVFSSETAGAQFIYVPVLPETVVRETSAVLPTVTVRIVKQEAPAFSASETLDRITVTVTAPEGVFPKDAVLSVRMVTAEEAQQVEAAVAGERPKDREAEQSYVFDIKVLGADGTELQPDTSKGTVTVSFALAQQEAAALSGDIYHVSGGKDEAPEEEGAALKAERLSAKEKDGTLSAQTGSFSYFVLDLPGQKAQAPEDGMESAVIQKLLRAGLSALAEGAASEVGSWVMEQVLAAVFPDMNDIAELKDMLNTVLANQSKMLEDLSDIKKQIQESQYDSILNDFQKLANASNAVNNAYGSLKRMDNELIEDPSKKDEIAQRRLVALTNGIGISDYQNSDADVDKFVRTMYSLITTSYSTTKATGQKMSTDLLGVSYECMRVNPAFVFEHQAWDSLEAFQNYAIGNYLLAAGIELLSLDARITRCKEQKLYTDDLETRKELLQKELVGSHTDTEDIIGVLEVLEKHKVNRQDEYRYFWVPGYEVKLYTQVEAHRMPRERRWSDPWQTYDVGWDFERSEGFPNEKATESFWAPFWESSVDGSAPVLSFADYDNLLKGYKTQTKKETSIYELLFDEKLGNCSKTGSIGIDESTPWLVDRNSKDHKFTVEKSGWYPYNQYDWTFYTYLVENKTGGSASASKWKLANYQRSITVFLFIPLNYAGYAWFERNNDNYAFAVPVKYGEKKMETPETPVMIIPDEPVYVDENDPDEDDALRGGAVPPVSAAVPAGADTSGSWEQTADGSWSYVKDGSAVSDSWLLIANTYADPAAGQKPYGWFRFDGAGKMLTGWYTDTDGSIYYLNPAADGTKGQMLTGWREIGGKWYYFSEAEGSGRLGALLTNMVTPDGYRVGADGAWDGAAPVR